MIIAWAYENGALNICSNLYWEYYRSAVCIYIGYLTVIVHIVIDLDKDVSVK